jgi:hypothetical protein
MPPLRATARRVATGPVSGRQRNSNNNDDVAPPTTPVADYAAAAPNAVSYSTTTHDTGSRLRCCRTQCHVTQHHYPACEPLLVGGDDGADDNGAEDDNDTNGAGW